MIIKDTQHKRILLMTNFGIDIWPKTITDAVDDRKRKKTLSTILDELYSRPAGSAMWGEIGGSIYNQTDLIDLINLISPTETLLMVESIPEYMYPQFLYKEYNNIEFHYGDGFYEVLDNWPSRIVPLTGNKSFTMPDLGDLPIGVVKIPLGVSVIAEGGFKGLKALSIVFPPGFGGFETLTGGAFDSAYVPLRMIFTSPYPPVISNWGFDPTWGPPTIYVPRLYKDQYYNAFIGTWPSSFELSIYEHDFDGQTFYYDNNKEFYNNKRLYPNDIISKTFIVDNRLTILLDTGLDQGDNEFELISIEIITPFWGELVDPLYGVYINFNFNYNGIVRMNRLITRMSDDYEETGMVISRTTSLTQGGEFNATIWYGPHAVSENCLFSRCDIDNFANLPKKISIRSLASGNDSGEGKYAEMIEESILTSPDSAPFKITRVFLMPNSPLPCGTVIIVRKR